ncbi:MAG TPA: VCBS repeat-containing protein [Bryobacteraceae bacterium]|nr:VCBS repeat-containing protein [Bryobacteraceae bacterium]HPT25452.1 VCBS repeat-containing protein [Bryobacteraceae bacterium]
MEQKTARPKSPTKRHSALLTGLTISAVLFGVPLLVLFYQAHRSGLSMGQVFEHIFKGARSADTQGSSPKTARGAKIDFLAPAQIGFQSTGPPRIGSLEIVDLDKDGLPDVLVADMLAQRIGWIRQSPDGVYTERWISPALAAPAHVSAADIDKDGDLDVLVACMGLLFPSNDKIGSVVIIENDGTQNFTTHTIIDHIARVTDVRSADLNGDGRLDLIVGQFGYDDGETRWMENLGNGQFRSHILQSLSGVIHAIPVDIDKDGDADIVSLVTQEWEEVYVFENDGRGNFKSHLIWGSTNEDYGSSGIRLTDLNKDGLVDVLLTNGDAFDYLPPRPRPWHSVQWLENQGKFKYEHHSIGQFLGASAAVAADLDVDGDLDVAAVTCYNFWERPDAQSIVWFENDGRMNFTEHDISNSPTHLISLESADMNKDGKPDLVSVRMNVYQPFTKDGRVVLWLNHWGQGQPKAGRTIPGSDFRQLASYFARDNP